MPRRKHPFPGNVLQTVSAFASPDVNDDEAGRRFTTRLPEAAVVTSLFNELDKDVDEIGTGHASAHRPVLDIDFPVHVIPSTTPGHYHLYLDIPMSWETYSELLIALAKAGVIEHGYESASKRRGFTAVRVPWVEKKLEPISCFRCGRAPSEIPGIVMGAQAEEQTPDEFARDDGTFNIYTNHFACDECYIAIGQPSSSMGWKAP